MKLVLHVLSYVALSVTLQFCFAELYFAVLLGQYFVMMSPGDITNSSSVSQRSVARLPLCSRPAVTSSVVRDDRRRQTHKEGTVLQWYRLQHSVLDTRKILAVILRL